MLKLVDRIDLKLIVLYVRVQFPPKRLDTRNLKLSTRIHTIILKWLSWLKRFPEKKKIAGSIPALGIIAGTSYSPLGPEFTRSNISLAITAR